MKCFEHAETPLLVSGAPYDQRRPDLLGVILGITTARVAFNVHADLSSTFVKIVRFLADALGECRIRVATVPAVGNRWPLGAPMPEQSLRRVVERTP